MIENYNSRSVRVNEVEQTQLKTVSAVIVRFNRGASISQSMWRSQHHAILQIVSVNQVLMRRLNSNDSLNINQIRVDVKCVLSSDLWRWFVDKVFSTDRDPHVCALCK